MHWPKPASHNESGRRDILPKPSRKRCRDVGEIAFSTKGRHHLCAPSLLSHGAPETKRLKLTSTALNGNARPRLCYARWYPPTSQERPLLASRRPTVMERVLPTDNPESAGSVCTATRRLTAV